VTRSHRMAAYLAAAALGLAAAGCGISEATNPGEAQGPATAASITQTVPSNPETTLPPIQTATSEKPTTTTTQETTTTTEKQTGVDPEFILNESPENLNPKIEPGKFLVTKEEARNYKKREYVIVDPNTIPEELQKPFEEANKPVVNFEQAHILWVGEKNRGLTMNAVLTDKDFAYTTMNVWGKINFFGGAPDSINYWKFEEHYDFPFMAIGIFEGLIPVPAGDSNPNDYYIKLKNPLTNEVMYGRIMNRHKFVTKLGIHAEFNTHLRLFNLQKRLQKRPSFSELAMEASGNNSFANIVKEHRLSEIIIPGDLLTIWPSAINQPPKYAFEPLIDERGVHLIAEIMVQRFDLDEINRIEAIISPDW
jgi:hypothetical protein